MSTASPSPAVTGQPRPWLTALIVAGAFFMEILDGTIIAPALPDMGASFGVTAVDLNIGISAYLITVAVFIPMSGWICDRMGARRVFASAIIVFTLASVLCAISNGLWTFTGARILQGIGGAMMVPVGRLIVLRSVEKRDLLRAIATLTWPGLAAPLLGPPLGGFMTSYASWRWIFLINVPLGALGFILASIYVRSSRRVNPIPFDWIGFALISATCIGLIYGFDKIAQQSNNSALAVLILGTSAFTGVVAFRRAENVQDPLVDVSSIRVQTFAAMLRAGFALRAAASAIPFLLPLMFQLAFGFSPFASGLLVLAHFSGVLGMKPLTSLILKRFGFRTTLILNGVVFSLSIIACGLFSVDTPLSIIVAVLFCSGISRSMQFTANITLAFVDVHEDQLSGANTLFNMMTQIGLAMGIAFGAIVLRIATALLRNTSNFDPAAQYQFAFVAVGVSTLVMLFDFFRLPFEAGRAVSDHKG